MNQTTRRELLASISSKEQHLADCRERRATPYLAELMQVWAGTTEIDFDYLARIIGYEMAEDEDSLCRGGRLMEFQIPDEHDPADWWKQESEGDDE